MKCKNCSILFTENDDFYFLFFQYANKFYYVNIPSNTIYSHELVEISKDNYFKILNGCSVSEYHAVDESITRTMFDLVNFSSVDEARKFFINKVKYLNFQ